jgi:hypothetical protein
MNFANILIMLQAASKAVLVFVDHNQQHIASVTTAVPSLKTVVAGITTAAELGESV